MREPSHLAAFREQQEHALKPELQGQVADER
jgi:hypothetical protein